MAWIESHQTLGHHPKTLRLAARLGCSLPTAVGYLHFLWWWALDYAVDGVMPLEAKPLIAQACWWKGRTEVFWEALESAGFVEHDAGTEVLNIHDWMDYAGRLVERRRANAERRKRTRSAGQTPDSRTTSPSLSAGQTHDGRTMTASRWQATGPDHTGPDLPPLGPLNASSPARARPPDVAPPRGPRPSNGETTTTDAHAPTPLPNGAQQCPTCPQVFTGSYADHLEQASTHKIRSTPEDFSSPSPQPRRKRGVLDVAAEVTAELDQLARAKAERGPVALDQALVAEHEAILARSRQRKSSLEDT